MDLVARIKQLEADLAQAIQEREEAILLAEKAAAERNRAEKAFAKVALCLAEMLSVVA